MAGRARHHRAGRTGSCIADAHRPRPAVGRALCSAAAQTHRRGGSFRRPGGRAPKEDGSGLELRPGYKKAEMGVIPEDWTTSSLRDIAGPTNAIAYGVLKPGDYVPNGIPLLQIRDVI